MSNQNCKHGFHLQLGQELFPLHLPPPVCPECGRNYSEENFIEACSGLEINPSDVDPFYGQRNK